MELTDAQKKKLVLLAELADGGDLVMVEKILQLKDEFDSQTEELKSAQENIQNLQGNIESTQKEIQNTIEYIRTLQSKVKNGENYVLTEADKKEIADTITVPVVHKITERTETIKEQPIVTEITKVTNEIKEVAVTDTPDQIVEKVNTSSYQIKKERIEGLIDLMMHVAANAVASVGITTTNFFRNGTLIGRAKNINFTGSAVTSVTVTGDQANISLSGGAGGGQVNSIVAGTNITVDSTDPANPIVSATGGGSFSVMVPSGALGQGVFVWPTAPSVIVEDNGNTMNKVSLDGTVNWTGTTTTTLTQFPNFNIYGY